MPQTISLDLIDPPSNPINDIDYGHVENLAEAYRRNDPLPPITVFPVSESRYEILFGQHRVEALRRIGKADILAFVLPERPPPLQMLRLQFGENNAHRDLSALERAQAFFKAKQLGNLTNKAVAQLFGVSEGTVSRDLTTDKNLHPTLKAMNLCPKMAWAAARLPLECQLEFHEGHKDMKAESYAENVSDKLAELGRTKPRERPVSGITPGGVRYSLPVKDLKATLAELKRLCAALEWVIAKRLNPEDISFYFRANPA